MTNKSNIYFDCFADVPDTRVKKKTRYDLFEIIALAICATIAGCNDWNAIEIFCEGKLDWFRTFLKLENGTPSHDTFGRVFAFINPSKFQECFIKWMNKIHQISEGEIIAIDGKTLRKSFDKLNNKFAIHMVSAWASKAGLVLGQTKVDEKSNEITAIPKLLDLLVVKGCIVTIDAMGCQKKIAKDIIDKEADYVLSLKGNQGDLCDDVKYFFDDCEKCQFKNIDHDYFKTFDTDHGRLETREYWMTNNIDWLNQKAEWAGLKAIGLAKSTRVVKDKTTVDRRLFITSLDQDAKKFAQAVRGHWGIENSLHWVLDVSFNEDQCRVRKDNAPENLAVLRHIAVNLLKQEKTCKKGIKPKRLKACVDQKYLEKVITG